jgi:hypothetical protein
MPLIPINDFCLPSGQQNIKLFCHALACHGTKKQYNLSLSKEHLENFALPKINSSLS